MSQFPLEQREPAILDRTAIVGSRAELISQSLKRAAKRTKNPKNAWVTGVSAPHRRWENVFAWGIVVSFGLFVLLPNAIASVYLAVVASNQFASEARFAVRGGQNVMDPLSGLIGMPSTQQIQDSLILTDYIESRGMVEAVDRELNLRQMFSRDNIDYFSKFNPSESIEELMYYWRRRVDVRIDSISGIITVLVRAYTPQDSLAIANKIVSQSESLVNELTERARRDALRQAQAELVRTNQNRLEKSKSMRDVRNTEGVLDTAKATEVMTQMLGDLRLELIKLQQEYATQRRTILPSSPQLRVLEARIDNMKDQVRRIENEMTDQGQGKTTLSASINRFEREGLDKEIAEKQYVAAAAAFERARIDLEAQQVYLATFLKPVLAQEALYPRRIWLWSIVTVITLLLWSSGVGTAVLVRNHAAV